MSTVTVGNRNHFPTAVLKLFCRPLLHQPPSAFYKRTLAPGRRTRPNLKTVSLEPSLISSYYKKPISARPKLLKFGATAAFDDERWRSHDFSAFGRKRPLSYSQLPPLPHPSNDATTEAVGVRLHLAGSTFDEHCLYIPPIRSGEGDPRQQAFTGSDTLGGALKAQPPACLRGISTSTSSIGTPFPLRTLLVQPRRNGVTRIPS